MKLSFPPIPPRLQSLLRRRLVAVPLLFLLALILLRFFPREPLLADQPWSRAVYATNGELLRLTLATDEQYRLWQTLGEIPASLQDAVLLYEDRWFYRHPGVNPVALFRAVADSATGKRRRGASTITMQLARRLYGIDSRTPLGKLQQILAALWIELRYGKRDILEAYLNVAPYGGNVEGAGAASEIFFRKPLSQITLPEAIALAVIPQNPQRRRVDRQADDVLLAARARLWQRWLAQHPQDAHLAADQALRLQAAKRETLPFEAPHLVDYLLRVAPPSTDADTPPPIHSTIDLRLQKLCERVIRDYLRTRADGIRNASALLLDSESMEVKAVVGSADYFAADIAGQVNGTLAKRSPGSTLKPFIYALALDQGHLHPRTMLKDAPTAFGPFSPENYDGHFVGPISAQDALIRSRNIPAVSVAAKLSHPDLYDFLRLGGVGRLNTREHYGLALVLGGGEVTMEELAQLYALLPNGGLVKPLRYVKETEVKSESLPPRLLSDEAAFITLDMLQHNVRPDTLAPARPAIAWKTGTSWGFRDAWTAGVFDRYVLVVWLGNFAGEGNSALIGIDTAAPLFLRLADAIRLERTGNSARPRLPPANLRQVEVCATSGDLADGLCRAKVNTWFIPGKSPIRGQRLHRRVHVDRKTGQAQCTPGPDTREEVYEYWGTDLQRVFRDAGLPRRAPPPLDCAAAEASDAPRIASPLRGETYTVRQSKPSPLMLRAEAGAGARKLYWWLDSTLIGASRPGETLFWQAPAPGAFTLRVVDESGRADERALRIEFLP